MLELRVTSVSQSHLRIFGDIVNCQLINPRNQVSTYFQAHLKGGRGTQFCALSQWELGGLRNLARECPTTGRAVSQPRPACLPTLAPAKFPKYLQILEPLSQINRIVAKAASPDHQLVLRSIDALRLRKHFRTPSPPHFAKIARNSVKPPWAIEATKDAQLRGKLKSKH